jgi:NAD(P)-dependent dehydrogenase (short-subunit alcohol dehydrogenase family)
MTDRTLHDVHAVVTGGGRGIGTAIARELARMGGRVTLMGRTAATLDAAARALRAELNAPVDWTPCDVTDAESVAAAFERAAQSFGPPGALVNNAGQAEGGPFTSIGRDVWDRLFAVNVTGVYLCTQRVLPAMLEARRGRIVNIASVAALKGFPSAAAYCATKHALLGLTRALAMETAAAGVTVNAVCPGYTRTDMADHAVSTIAATAGKSLEEARTIITRTVPRGRLIEPDEVASLVAWLCTPAAGAVTGQAIAVAGTAV